MFTKRLMLGLCLCIALIVAGFAGYEFFQNSNLSNTLTTPKLLPSFNPLASAPSASTDNRLVIGTLSAPSANINALPITVGTDDTTLNTGMAGAYEWGSPGQPGVFAMAGHRVGAGGPFRHLDQIHIGDRITVASEGIRYIYRVIKNEVVTPGQTSVLNGPASESRIVLITCTPMKTYTHRIVVTGQLIDVVKQAEE